MATLLLDLCSEEIPSRMQRGAAEQLQRLVTAGFDKAGLKPAEVKTFVSPRHLAIQLFGLPEMQEDVREEHKGPAVGANAQAIHGFLKKHQITEQQCEQRSIGDVTHYFAIIERKGQPTADVAKKIIEDALAAFTWPKSMRWGAGSQQWVRPLHAIACLLDKKIVPVTFGNLTASNITVGHRFLSPAAITLGSAEEYVGALEKVHVLVDFAARRQKIQAEVAALAQKNDLQVVADDALLDEVTGLVEWPVPLLGEFEKSFLDLPKEVLISEMKVHQRYFALEDASGKLSNRFIAVANMVTSDGGKSVIAGNARVLRARLSDGAFYWEQDRKKPLTEWAKGLADVVFHAKVEAGMMSDKVVRIGKLATAIAEKVGFKDTAAVKQAAQLCKADLTTGMVGEFPELQGIMGRYYALEQKHDAKIADAIRDHYKPVGANDSLPGSDLAAIIAMADKLDSITSLFAAGEKPTGSKDPFALRRAALGILRILLDKGWALDLAQLNAKPEVLDFFRDRLQNLLKDEGLNHDVVEAALTAPTQGFNPVVMANSARALAAWVKSSDGTAALAAINRALNILAAEEKKAKQPFRFQDGASLNEAVEKDLLKALKATKATKPADLNALTAPINNFFERVLVNEPAHREARLSLLAGVRECANQIADFSKIEG